MKALVTGCMGQDGSYLCELLVSKGYEVHGLTHSRKIGMELEGVKIHIGSVCLPETLDLLVDLIQPDEVYNLAAQSHVGRSFDHPLITMDATGIGALNVFEAVRRFAPKARVYQASSSEMFGNAPAPQSEATPFAPVSPYGCAKLFAHNMARVYREAYGLHISCGILFNHESPRRGEQFVTRKICKGLARIKAGLQDKLVLGNLAARRDWGYAPEYVEAMWLMLQRDTPGDYVVGTGESWMVGQFLTVCLSVADIQRSNIECGTSRELRPTEIGELIADNFRAVCDLGWEAKTLMQDLAKIMMEAELKAVGL